MDITEHPEYALVYAGFMEQRGHSRADWALTQMISISLYNDNADIAAMRATAQAIEDATSALEAEDDE